MKPSYSPSPSSGPTQSIFGCIIDFISNFFNTDCSPSSENEEEDEEDTKY